MSRLPVTEIRLPAELETDEPETLELRTPDGVESVEVLGRLEVMDVGVRETFERGLGLDFIATGSRLEMTDA